MSFITGLRASQHRYTESLPLPADPAESEVPRTLTLNEGRWPENLPEEEKDSVETYAEAFTRAIAGEGSLSPGKLSMGAYKAKGGHPLTGTPCEDAWNACLARIFHTFS
jgi:hypothetical protein